MFEKEREAVLKRVRMQAVSGKRYIIAIAGPPAAGKSTLAEMIVDDLNQAGQQKATLVPMDGFHLDNQTLDERGLRHRKGAPETFDAQGFAGLVRQIAAGGEAVSYPTFDRRTDSTVPDSAMVGPDVDIVVFEGNYLLLNDEPWRQLLPVYDLTVFVRQTCTTLEQRLIERWLGYGVDRENAEIKAKINDLPNAVNILENSITPDLDLTGS